MALLHFVNPSSFSAAISLILRIRLSIIVCADYRLADFHNLHKSTKMFVNNKQHKKPHRQSAVRLSPCPITIYFTGCSMTLVPKAGVSLGRPLVKTVYIFPASSVRVAVPGLLLVAASR